LRTILLIEDNPDHVELIKAEFQRLKGDDCHLIIVFDGREALDYLFRRRKYSDAKTAPRPDRIILDLKLPDMNGIQVLERIESDSILKQIPVMVLTTSSQIEDREKCLELGAKAFISKPTNYDKFAAIIEEI